MNDSLPKLDPPGAGVPLSQRIAMRFFLRPLVAHRAPWEESDARFRKLASRVEDKLEGLSEADLGRRVLVPPQAGLEDSSRYWSIAMTLDHVAIVGRQIAYLLRELDAGRPPAAKADTAKVKPSSDRTVAESLASFRAFAHEEFPGLFSSLSKKNERLTFPHPWFGPLRARGWYWLQATHLHLHAQQIDAIKAALRG
jgi:hypothetical protein